MLNDRIIARMGPFPADTKVTMTDHPTPPELPLKQQEFHVRRGETLVIHATKEPQ